MTFQDQIIGLIPSRLESTRLPGKALADIEGMPLVIHTAKRAKLSKVLDEVFVCTDSPKIMNVCDKFNVRYIATGNTFANGTERIASTIENLNKYDYFVDIQGDEPLIDPTHIDAVATCLVKNSSDYGIILPVLRVPYGASESIIRVQVSISGRVMTLSRASIPHRYARGTQAILKHLSIVGFTREALMAYSKLPPSPNEEIESIELLRALENDISILSLALQGGSFSVDLQDDLDRARLAMLNDKYHGMY
jgi:3-deoxy-manno-octulosonate cytidylyltransferase (CMP-KDO synthetase)